jgi:hypothetical protein
MWRMTLLSLSVIAERLGLTGPDRERSARRRILASGCIFRRDGRRVMMTEEDWLAYLDLIKMPSRPGPGLPPAAKIAG